METFKRDWGSVGKQIEKQRGRKKERVNLRRKNRETLKGGEGVEDFGKRCI